MKTISAFLLIVLIYAINSNLDNFERQDCLNHAPNFFSARTGTNQAYSLDFCRSTYFTSTYAQCCFIKWKDNNERRRYNCYPVLPAELLDIDIATEKIEKDINDIIGPNGELDSLDCSSSYLYGSLLIIAALLF